MPSPIPSSLPDIEPGSGSLQEAYRYCHGFLSHYENFQLASWLFPRHLRPGLSAVYAFARFSDDLADITTVPLQERQQCLERWSELVGTLPNSASAHPILLALNHATNQHSLPPEAFENLLSAFRQDLQTNRYEEDASLLDYCRRSANPVGRIMLAFYGGATKKVTPTAFPASDALCTGLQLANFWQDLSEDLAENRLYIPLNRLRAHGLPKDPSTLLKTPRDAFQPLLQELLAWTRELLFTGLTLQPQIPRRHRLDIRLYAGGGLAILDAVSDPQFDILRERPHLSKATHLRIVLKALMGFPKHS
jgi:squalene synthase HpnC